MCQESVVVGVPGLLIVLLLLSVSASVEIELERKEGGKGVAVYDMSTFPSICGLPRTIEMIRMTANQCRIKRDWFVGDLMRFLAKEGRKREEVKACIKKKSSRGLYPTLPVPANSNVTTKITSSITLSISSGVG